MTNEEYTQIKEARKEICNSCENRKPIVSFDVLQKRYEFDICELCKCPIFKVIKRPDGCNIGKW